MRRLMFASAILAVTMTTASAQSSIMGGGGFAPCSICGSGGNQYYPPAQTARQKAATARQYELGRRFNAPKVNPQVNSYGACDSTCQAKCQATWRPGGFPNVRACYAKWSRLNANPELARACDAANRANGWRHTPGC